MDRYEVSAKAARGRWRAGRQWFRTPTDVGRDELTDEEWDRLRADPMIVVAEPGERTPPPDDPEALREALDAAHDRIVSLEADLRSGADENADLCARIAGLEAELDAAVRNESTASAPAAGAADASGDAGASPHPTREERIRGAVATALETDGPDLRTSTGRPVLARVREISGVDDVSAAERDAAWSEIRGADDGG